MSKMKWKKAGIVTGFTGVLVLSVTLLGMVLLSCTPVTETEATAQSTSQSAAIATQEQDAPSQTAQTAASDTQPADTTPPTTKPAETTPPTTKPADTTPPTTKPADTTPPTTKPADTTQPTTQPAETTPPVTQPQEDIPPETTLPAVTPTVPDEIEGAPTVTLPTETEPETGENLGVQLPCEVPEQGLRIEKISPYSGVFVEDGTNRRLGDMAMMLVTNTGTSPVEYTVITATYEGGEVEFRLSSLPAGASAVVQAQDAAPVPEGQLLSCSATVIHRGALELNGDQVSVVDNADGSLTVTNLTKNTIPAVRIFYKYFMEEEALYVGGITFTAKVTELKAGEAVSIRPAHYSAGASRVMMVGLYDTAQ